MSLISKLVKVEEIDESILENMYHLMEATYFGTSLSKIKRDLSNKQYILLLYNDQNTLKGFTTMQLFDSTFRGKNVKIIYSGDTVIDEDSRGEIELMRAWWQFSYKVQKEYMDTDVYWMLISKGWRTYKFFPLFLKEFYPTREKETPEEFKDFIERIGKFKFPEEYQNGLIIPNSPDFLKNADHDVPEHKKDDPDIQFFLNANPNFKHGNELVCVAHLSPDNLTKIGLRLLHGQRN